MSIAAIGGLEMVRRRLSHLLQETGGLERMFTPDGYEHALRLRSFEIAGNVMKELSLARA